MTEIGLQNIDLNFLSNSALTKLATPAILIYEFLILSRVIPSALYQIKVNQLHHQKLPITSTSCSTWLDYQQFLTSYS